METAAGPVTTRVPTVGEKSSPRGLPVQQPDSAWIAIYNEFKSAS